ncbi:hypothetical protein [Pseudoxanthomonas mexicana]
MKTAFNATAASSLSVSRTLSSCTEPARACSPRTTGALTSVMSNSGRRPSTLSLTFTRPVSTGAAPVVSMV